MRITNGMQSASMLRSLQGSNERAMRLQEQLSTGRRINRPSDDPVGISRTLKLNRDLCENEQYTKNAQDAKAILDATDTALGGVNDILQRLHELAINGANDTLPQESKNALAYEVDELLGQLIQVGNTTYSGIYIFAGEKVDTEPYTLTGGPPATGVTFNGNDGKRSYEIGPGIKDTINLTGHAEVFGDETTHNSIFDHVIQLRDALLAGDTTSVNNSIEVMSRDLDSILNLRSIVGAKYNKMELSLGRLSTANTTITQQIADSGDTDIAQAIMQLKLEENVYQSALAVGSRTIPPSLADYLT